MSDCVVKVQIRLQICSALKEAKTDTFRRQEHIRAENLILTQTAANPQAHQKMS